MSQTNTNANNSQNRNQKTERSGRDQGAPNSSGRGGCRNGRGNNLIAKYPFEQKMKDGLISKLTITKTGHWPSQFKKICDAVSVSCADKNYWALDEVLRTRRNKVEDDFMPAYPDATPWSTTHQVQITSVHLTTSLVEGTNIRLITYQVMEQTIGTDANLQKQLLFEYKRNSKNKSQQYNKFLADKESLIMILFGQCDEAT